jgi:Flp pilus assembly protein TadD
MDPESKIDQFLEIVELTPEDEIAHYGLAQEYMKAGRFEDGVASLRKVIEMKPHYAAAYRELGKALDKAGHFGEAKDFLLKGRALAQAHGDGQMVKEIDVFLKRMERKNQA